jgi:Protein of unknown function (DUF1810)
VAKPTKPRSWRTTSFLWSARYALWRINQSLKELSTTDTVTTNIIRCGTQDVSAQSQKALQAREYGAALRIGSKRETAAYLNHDILGPHLIKCTRLVMAVSENQITDGLESPVDMKFRSSMTLFDSI